VSALPTTDAIILRTYPYGETSSIFHLLTKDYGLVHGIAKGVRGNKKSVSYFERGFIIECSIYARTTRDLQTLTNLSVIYYGEKTRKAFIKPAVRDLCFEIIESAITDSDPHQPLYTLCEKMLHYLDEQPESRAYPAILWRFVFRFLALLGYGFDISRCSHCSQTTLTQGCYLDVNDGSVLCGTCSHNRSPHTYLPPEALYLMKGMIVSPRSLPDEEGLSKMTCLSITRLLCRFCYYHFEKHREFKSLSFFETSF